MPKKLLGSGGDLRVRQSRYQPILIMITVSLRPMSIRKVNGSFTRMLFNAVHHKHLLFRAVLMDTWYAAKDGFYSLNSWTKFITVP